MVLTVLSSSAIGREDEYDDKGDEDNLVGRWAPQFR
jgi:hypothetical protein